MTPRRCCLVTSLINKLTDWTPNYHKMNKLTLHEPAMRQTEHYHNLYDQVHQIYLSPVSDSVAYFLGFF